MSRIIRKTFDRDIYLLDESPPGINLPWGFNLIRFETCPSHRAVPLIPLAPMHVSELVAGDFGEALCGEKWRVGMDISHLSEGKSYPFCCKCQEAAGRILDEQARQEADSP
jgi:hypothetical protein